LFLPRKKIGVNKYILFAVEGEGEDEVEDADEGDKIAYAI